MRVGLLVSLAIVGVLAGAEADAGARRDYEVTYFSDRTLRTEIGRFYKPCGTGAARLTGRRSRFFVKSQSTCPGSGPIGGATLSCHFYEAGCSDALARSIPARARIDTKARSGT